MSTLLAAADLHCQANLEPEPFGVTFVEALAAGLPVVSVNEGGVVEIVDRSCGLLVPSRDVRALPSLATLVDDDGYRHQLASGTQARARHLCYSSTQVVRLRRGPGWPGTAGDGRVTMPSLAMPASLEARARQSLGSATTPSTG